MPLTVPVPTTCCVKVPRFETPQFVGNVPGVPATAPTIVLLRIQLFGAYTSVPAELNCVALLARVKVMRLEKWPSAKRRSRLGRRRGEPWPPMDASLVARSRMSGPRAYASSSVSSRVPSAAPARMTAMLGVAGTSRSRRSPAAMKWLVVALAVCEAEPML